MYSRGNKLKRVVGFWGFFLQRVVTIRVDRGVGISLSQNPNMSFPMLQEWLHLWLLSDLSDPGFVFVCNLAFLLFYLWESRSNKWSVTNGVFLLKPAVWAADQGNETAAWREHQEINGPNCTGAKGNAKKVCVEWEEPKACCLPQRCGGLGHFFPNFVFSIPLSSPKWVLG